MLKSVLVKSHLLHLLCFAHLIMAAFPRRLLCLFLYSLHVIFASWVGPDDDGSVLPTATSDMIAGYLNESIFLLGGSQSDHTVAVYDIGSDTITSADATSISQYVSGINIYAQIGSKLYIYYFWDSYFIVCDLAEYGNGNPITYNHNIIGSDSNNHSLPYHLDASSCITSYDDTLIVIGGVTLISADASGLSVSTGSTEVSLYNTTESAWSSGPSLNWRREQFACVLEEDSSYLYAISGVWESSIERIQISNVLSNSGLNHFAVDSAKINWLN